MPRSATTGLASGHEGSTGWALAPEDPGIPTDQPAPKGPRWPWHRAEEAVRARAVSADQAAVRDLAGRAALEASEVQAGAAVLAAGAAVSADQAARVDVATGAASSADAIPTPSE